MNDDSSRALPRLETSYPQPLTSFAYTVHTRSTISVNPRHDRNQKDVVFFQLVDHDCMFNYT